MLYKAVFAEYPRSILVHPKKVSAYMRAHSSSRCYIQYTESLYLIHQHTNTESCPKSSVLHGMGLPATADLDIAEVKAKKAREAELAVSGN